MSSIQIEFKSSKNKLVYFMLFHNVRSVIKDTHYHSVSSVQEIAILNWYSVFIFWGSTTSPLVSVRGYQWIGTCNTFVSVPS